MTTTNTDSVSPQQIPPLDPDLDMGMRRLKLAAVRRQAPEVLLTAKTQHWTPEELLRTLIDAESTARDASNIRNRLKPPGSPSPKRWIASMWPPHRSRPTRSPTWNHRNGYAPNTIW
ncbi:putative transposition helper protein [Gordonia aichiensis NBRC 108223]|uniref:Putative transposition helper protein n=1 Tax=Gordonia aichiensis NBRC 108223 TaxID=1220583 RepID=L7KMC8_9ACTN|nr:putative transposition helper protein [Gordonia aichiensis NBRC 108223]